MEVEVTQSRAENNIGGWRLEAGGLHLLIRVFGGVFDLGPTQSRVLTMTTISYFFTSLL